MEPISRAAVTGLGFACSLLFLSCSPSPIFPQGVRERTDSLFDFQAWKTTSRGLSGRKIEIGGRIVETHTGGSGTRIIVAELPIVHRPFYGPTDVMRSKGLFIVSLPGPVDSKWTQEGNRLIAIGTTGAREGGSVDEVVRLLPTLQAICIHFWATLGSEISQFTHTGSHEAAPEKTMCWE
jgi:starvation-inducible outer membrane lipoprotein